MPSPILYVAVAVRYYCAKQSYCVDHTYYQRSKCLKLSGGMLYYSDFLICAITTLNVVYSNSSKRKNISIVKVKKLFLR